MSRFDGIEIRVVEPGTVITDERTGKAFTVTDSEVITASGFMWCTEKILGALKEKLGK